ncbi:uncharacterized protein LOC141883796 isoform X1 [Acropora palmata]|uniref:uncharacterized protein LOC141883796 isoform X1 n=1 Tax=Acropora palmata TaxID=6131 RepID=UPI003DA054F6
MVVERIWSNRSNLPRRKVYAIIEMSYGDAHTGTFLCRHSIEFNCMEIRISNMFNPSQLARSSGTVARLESVWSAPQEIFELRGLIKQRRQV